MEARPDGAASWVEYFETRGLPAPELQLDIEVPALAWRAEVDRLVELGATQGPEQTMNPDDPDAHWVVMQDPEGNEFCIGG